MPAYNSRLPSACRGPSPAHTRREVLTSALWQEGGELPAEGARWVVTAQCVSEEAPGAEDLGMGPDEP